MTVVIMLAKPFELVTHVNRKALQRPAPTHGCMVCYTILNLDTKYIPSDGLASFSLNPFLTDV